MFCKRCGKEIEDNARECPFCGAQESDYPERIPQKGGVGGRDFGRESYSRRKNNGMAIAGFICSIFSILFGLVFGIIGLRQCKEYGDEGRGLAMAGIIISSLKIGFILLTVLTTIF